jgi:uncharacterized NAD(P)/FAD-binding protein YdhS
MVAVTLRQLAASTSSILIMGYRRQLTRHQAFFWRQVLPRVERTLAAGVLSLAARTGDRRVLSNRFVMLAAKKRVLPQGAPGGKMRFFSCRQKTFLASGLHEKL